VEVHLRGFDLFVSEPRHDDGGVGVGVQEAHRRRVTQDAWRDRLGGEGRPALGGVGGVPGDPLSFVEETCSSDLVPEGETPPKLGDFIHWTELLANHLAAGKSTAALRSYLKKLASETWLADIA
jgi:hypothetical protein